MNIVLLSGYAKLPAHITSEELYKTLVLVMEVDMDTGKIVEVECSIATELAKEFVSDIMVGYTFENGVDDLLHTFDEKFFGSTKKAIMTSLKIIYAKYKELRDHTGGFPPRVIDGGKEMCG